MTNVIDIRAARNVRDFAAFLANLGRQSLARRILADVSRHEGLGPLDPTQGYGFTQFQLADEFAIAHGALAEGASVHSGGGTEVINLGKDRGAGTHTP